MAGRLEARRVRRFLEPPLSIAPGWRSVEWRLGGPAGTFAGVAAAMEAGQHTAAEVAPHRVLLFDNGRDRASGAYSRVLELALDPSARTANVVWEYRPAPDIYAPIISSARRLANGNRVAAFGTAGGFRPSPDEPAATGPITLVEIAPDRAPVWRMDVKAGASLIYRATPLLAVAGERSLAARR